MMSKEKWSLLLRLLEKNEKTMRVVWSKHRRMSNVCKLKLLSLKKQTNKTENKETNEQQQKHRA